MKFVYHVFYERWFYYNFFNIILTENGGLYRGRISNLALLRDMPAERVEMYRHMAELNFSSFVISLGKVA